MILGTVSFVTRSRKKLESFYQNRHLELEEGLTYHSDRPIVAESDFRNDGKSYNFQIRIFEILHPKTFILALNKMWFKGGKADPLRFRVFLNDNNLPQSLIVRYRENRVHILFLSWWPPTSLTTLI